MADPTARIHPTAARQLSPSATQKPADRMLAELEQILDQVAAGSTSEKTVDTKQPLVLFGAGRAGLITLAGLRKIGIEPAAWADNNPRLHGTVVEGLTVYSPAEASAKFGGSATFVVTVYTGAGVRRQLADMGLRVVSFARIYRQFPDAFLPYWSLDRPSKLIPHREEILRCGEIWADDASRREYLAQIRYRAFLDESLPPSNSGETYFPQELFKLSPEETFVDCGAFDGDTVRAFLKSSGGKFRQIVALEPDPSNFERLTALVAALPEDQRRKIHLVQAAVGIRRETLRFEASGTEGSLVTEKGGYEVLCQPLDEVLTQFGTSFIKMDIEGSELQALKGAENTIREHVPALAVCLYHRQADLWTIPLFIASLSDKYRFFLRRYSDDCWEQIVYAVPADRLA